MAKSADESTGKSASDLSRGSTCAALSEPFGETAGEHTRAPRPSTKERANADNFFASARSNAPSHASRRRAIGARFEAHALAFLRREGHECVARNVNCRGGELDLVMRERDGTLVFVEVRARARPEFGGAAASVGWRKQQRVLCAARHFLSTISAGAVNTANAASGAPIPPCRFDVIAFESGRLVWLRDAFGFEAGET
nr:YraN family protein [Paraburkholderia acidisoli]